PRCSSRCATRRCRRCCRRRNGGCCCCSRCCSRCCCSCRCCSSCCGWRRCPCWCRRRCPLRRHLGIGIGIATGADARVEPHAQHPAIGGAQAVVIADERTRLGLHVGHRIVTRCPGHSEPGSALVVGIRLVPAAQEIIGILAAIVPANPDLAALGHSHPGIILVLALRVGIDLLGRREGDAAVG